MGGAAEVTLTVKGWARLWVPLRILATGKMVWPAMTVTDNREGAPCE